MDTDNMVDADGNLVALNPRKRIKFKLIEKEVRDCIEPTCSSGSHCMTF